MVGIDIDAQPRYPYTFVQGDALKLLKDKGFVRQFSAIHASFPCQHYKMGTLRTTQPTRDLVTPGRSLLCRTGLPWVMENVIGSPLDPVRSITLCANAFGLRSYRHRLFEPSPGLSLEAPPHLQHLKPVANSRRRERWRSGWHASITGDIGTYIGPEAMGIDWMTGNGLSQAIPPAYTRWIGARLLGAL